jgi:hypothetical protein
MRLRSNVFLRTALISFLVFAGRTAEAASISIAGADCGTPPLLGLTFIVPLSGESTGVACPDSPILGSLVNPDGTPAYGPEVTSVEFSISNPDQITDDNPLIVDLTSALGAGFTFSNVDRGFILAGKPGIVVGCPVGDFDVAPACVDDAVITFSGFEPGTTVVVEAVNGIAAVPEPATLVLTLGGLAVLRTRRRSRR